MVLLHVTTLVVTTLVVAVHLVMVLLPLLLARGGAHPKQLNSV